MSDLSIDQPRKQRRRASVVTLCRIAFRAVAILGIGLLSLAILGEPAVAGSDHPLPLLVRASRGDTPATLAGRYLNDAGKAWMIVEYNGMVTFSEGQAVLIPTEPFRLGGLTVDGYQTVPVLAYGTIGESGPPKAQLSRAAFEEQMSWLKNSGYTAISPRQLIDFMELSGQLPRHAVLITADTESSTFFDQAAPILRSLGLTATLCVATARIGKPGNMTWDQLKQLGEAGFAIGCRGRYGRSLTRRRGNQPFEITVASIASELHQARMEVEDQAGVECRVLAYPQGRADALVTAMAAKIGFSLAFLQSAGENPFFGNRFGIHRVAIDRPLGPGEFTQMLATMVAMDLH